MLSDDVVKTVNHLRMSGMLGALPTEVAVCVGETARRHGQYLEWGVGGSTRLVSHLGVERIRGIETDRNWIEVLASESDLAAGISRGRVELIHVDLGPTRSWGFPKSPCNPGQASAYHLWQVLSVASESNGNPIAVFIDGRFRVACAAAACGLLPAGSTIIVDDYADRDHYGAIRDLTREMTIIGRAAMWNIPESVSRGWQAVLNAFAADPR